MNSEEPRIHVGGVRRNIRHSDGSTSEITVNWSQIPATASPTFFKMMRETTEVAITELLDELSGKACPPKLANASAFAAAPAPAPEPEAAPEPACVGCGAAMDSEKGLFLCDDDQYRCDDCAEERDQAILKAREAERLSQAFQPAEEDLATVAKTHSEQVEQFITANFPEEIPRDDEVRTSAFALGIQIPYPPEEWTAEDITEVNTDGTGGGQLLAINASLTGIGYGNKLRHGAAQAILDAYGPIHGKPVPQITSMKNLSKADAHVVLCWIERATAASLQELGAATKMAVAA